MLPKRKFSHSFFQSISCQETNFLFHPHFENNGFTSLIILQVCVWCVCVCVCVCVSVCVFLYSSTVKASSNCKMSKTNLRGSDQRSCVVNIYVFMWVLLPSSFISISENVIIHLQRQKLQTRKPVTYWREKHTIRCSPRKMIYNDIGYKSVPTQSIKSDEKMLKIRRLL